MQKRYIGVEQLKKYRKELCLQCCMQQTSVLSVL